MSGVICWPVRMFAGGVSRDIHARELRALDI